MLTQFLKQKLETQFWTLGTPENMMRPYQRFGSRWNINCQRDNVFLYDADPVFDINFHEESDDNTSIHFAPAIMDNFPGALISP